MVRDDECIKQRSLIILVSSLVLVLCWVSVSAQAQTESPNKASSQDNSRAPKLSVEVVDLTPRFIKFYETATAEKADPERRWQLWQQLYGFAAVPPTPEGKAMARTLLDKAWSQYPKVMARIRQGAAVLKPSPQSILESVVKLLKSTQYPIKVRVIVFVGELENNAFAYVDKEGVSVVAVPVESSDEDLQLNLTHEFTHAVHIKIAGLPGTWERSIAETILLEGLAMRVTEKLIPGKTPEFYTSARSNEWLPEADKRQTDILKGIQQHLDESDSETVTKFTFGDGTTGLKREAYYAGWIIVGQLERQGMTLADIAKLPRSSMDEVINDEINALIKAKR